MTKYEDLTGKKFNYLTVLELKRNNKTKIQWLCQCDCGNTVIVLASHLKNAHTKSCGCFRKNKLTKENPKYKHGKRHSRIYSVWINMKTRCYNKNVKAYKNYGNRGIKVCNEWIGKEKGFINFYNWAIQNGYRDDLTIERINVDGNYEPNNCRWGTYKQQNNNKRSNMYIEYNNEKHTLQEWSEILPIKISSNALRYRIVKGWGVEKSFNTPVYANERNRK